MKAIATPVRETRCTAEHPKRTYTGRFSAINVAFTPLYDRQHQNNTVDRIVTDYGGKQIKNDMDRIDFTGSIERFEKIDADNFSDCLNTMRTNSIYLEWRMRNSDGKLCIIQFYRANKGYQIYVSD